MQDGEGARGFDAQIRAKGECVSARALVDEVLSSSKVGCISVAYSQVASNRGRQQYRTLALWGPWYEGPKQRTRSHTTAMPLLQGPLRLALAAGAVVDVVVDVEVREDGGLTHQATRAGATTTRLPQQLVRRRGRSRGGGSSQRMSAAVRSANSGEGGGRRCGSGDTSLLPLSRHEGWQRSLRRGGGRGVVLR